MRIRPLLTLVSCFAALWMTPERAVAGTTWGGRGFDAAYAVTTDALGFIYVAGTTDSMVFGGFGRRSSRDVFVAKFNPSATQVLYLNYFGGAGVDAARAIAVDSSGNAYVAGTTNSADFPTTAGAVSRTNAGLNDVFVTKLDFTGSIVYSTLLGSFASDQAFGIAVDTAGNAYIAGQTAGTYPTTASAFQRLAKGAGDCFVTKLNASGSALVYSTLLGGSGADSCNGIAVDSAGNAYVAGLTQSSDFPTQAALQNALRGDSDAFVAKLNAAGSALAYSTYFGGSSYDSASAIKVDASGAAYVAGETLSWDFPAAAPPKGDLDAFAIKLAPAGGSILFATVLGGSGTDSATGIALDGTDRVAISGVTNSTGLRLRYPLQNWLNGHYDGFAAVLNADGLLLFGSYLGGTLEDRSFGVAATSSAIYMIGSTQSPDFPGADAGAVTPGDSDIFLVRVPGGWPDVPPAAQFVKVDAATRGTWKGTYGGQGYAIVNHAFNYPGYVSAVPNAAAHTWTAATTDTRALQQASSSQRIASVWYGPNTVTVDLTFNDELAHQLAVYCLDWDAAGRTQTIEILNGAGVVVDSRTVSGFSNGVWVVWNVAGRVQVRATRTGPMNAVISGLFFGEAVPVPVQVTVSPGAVILTGGGAQQFTAAVENTANKSVTWSIAPPVGSIDSSGRYTAPGTVGSLQTVTVTATSAADSSAAGQASITLSPASGTAAATFSKIDRTTQGAWQGVYGNEGYNVLSHAVSYPAYVSPTPSGHLAHTWAASTFDVRALQQVSGSQRVAGVWYTAGSMTVDLPITDGKTHELAVYCLDWDNVGRSQTLEILNLAGAVLDTRTVSAFSSGAWVVWQVSGHVRLRVTRVAGMNAVVSGLFFNSVVPSIFRRLDAATQGSWKGVYGGEGHQIVGAAASLPAYVVPAAAGAATHVWAASTSNVRALQQPGASTDRIAGVWYAANQFVIDLPFAGGTTRQLAAYFLDWDQVGRTQTVEILNASGTVLDTRNVSGFGNGTWLVWNVAGPVKLRVTRTGPLNAVLSGIFFDPAN